MHFSLFRYYAILNSLSKSHKVVWKLDCHESWIQMIGIVELHKVGVGAELLSFNILYI